MKNNRRPIRQDDPNVVAVLHRVGRRFRALIARLPAVGNGGHDRPTLIAHCEFRADEGTAIRQWIDQHQAGSVLNVLPAGSVICRVCTLPDVAEEQLGPALRLQAEAHLLGLAPSHRLGMAVLDQAPGETARTGLILAWPESAAVEKPPISPDEHREIRYVPDIAAVAALMNGDRPTHPLLFVDHQYGSVAMAITHASGVVFRGLREDPSNAEAWREAVTRALAESSLNAGHTPSFIEALVENTKTQLETVDPDEARLLAPSGLLDSMRQRLADAPQDAEWWARFGAAAGAVIARAGSLAPLTRLEREEPVQSPSVIDRVTTKLSTPSAAAWAVVACIAILLFSPMVLSGLRLGVLSLRHGNLPEQLRAVNNVRNKLVVYRELNRSAWPMTKMLADIACNTPEGIELEQVRITPNRTFTVNGRAIPADDRSATEVVTLMQDHLRQSGIFNEITLNWGDSDSFGHYSFELTARLHRPYFQYEYPVELDFGKYTMVDRRDGRMPGESGSGGPLADALAMNELGSASDAAARSLEMKPDQPGSRRGDDGSDFRAPGNGRTNIDRSAEQAERLADAGTAREVKPPAADSEKPNRSSGPSGSRISRPFSPGRTPYGDAGRIGDGSESVTMPPSEQIPEPLTEQQVNAMSVSEAREALLKVSTARRYARHRSDEELKERLEREFDWLMNRMRAGGGDS